MAIPTAPQNLVPTAGDSTVTLEFDPVVAVPVVTDYIAQYSVDQTNWTTFNDGTSTSTIITINPIVNNQLYYFRVFAVNNDGNGDFSSIVQTTPQNFSIVEYCTVNDVSKRLRSIFGANTLPDDGTITSFILQAQEYIDRSTGHSWRQNRQMRNETFNTTRLYDWGQGMPLYMKHHQIKLPLDASKGDKVEFWDGEKYNEFDLPDGLGGNFHIQSDLGILYLRGWFLTYFRRHRFRITYRYGSSQEGELVPEDIQEACILLAGMKVLNTDFKMSLIPYSEEGKVEKTRLLSVWKKEVDRILHLHKEIQTVW